MFKNEMVKYGLILFLITSVVGLSLSYVNVLTKGIISEREKVMAQQARVAALGNLAEGAEEIEINETTNPVVKGVWEYSKNGKVLGYAVNTITTGYNPNVNIMVGIDAAQKVKGVSIVSLSETPGLGSKASDKSFLEQFTKKELGIKVKKNGPLDPTEIQAISGATKTSQAVADGVNIALEEVKTIIERGNPPQVETPEVVEIVEGEVLPDEAQTDIQ